MIIHELKIEDNYLKNLLLGTKKSEIRLNDRDYQVGDVLEFKEYKEYPNDLNPITHHFEITHIHSGLGLKECYVALSISYKSSLDN